MSAPSRGPSFRRLASLPILLAAVLLVAAAGVPAATNASSDGFRLDVSRDGDFVAQTNFVQCVGASMQMMLNMIRTSDDRTAGTQLSLQKLARGLSGERPDGRIRQGASVRGWSAGLTQLDAGPYKLAGTTTIDEALRLAAKSIRETGRPVGLLMWQGRHAWVMSGFKATADPRQTNDFRVTEAIVLDPLYPYGSRKWGPSPKPGDALTVAELGRQFVPRRSGASASLWLAGFGGKYVIVMPYELREVARYRAVAV
ncbi:MAG TPA: hypothetical protein VKA85_05355 [Candidatus Limnocylindrales bacterium]|nr:hypothetical protein [Candidatus Limnocylindrales bacterium]